MTTIEEVLQMFNAKLNSMPINDLLDLIDPDGSIECMEVEYE